MFFSVVKSSLYIYKSDEWNVKNNAYQTCSSRVGQSHQTDLITEVASVKVQASRRLMPHLPIDPLLPVEQEQRDLKANPGMRSELSNKE